MGTSDFRAFPKIELHRHIPGSMRFETWLQIVRSRGVKLPSDSPEALREMMTVRDLAPLKDYLRCFEITDLAYTDSEAIETFTYEAIVDAVAERILYLELRASPTRMAVRAGISTAQALGAMVKGRDRAQAEFGISVGLIAGLSREMGVDVCAREAETIVDFAGKGIQAIDLLGNEIDYPADWFEPIFRPIAESGRMGITIHAGESSGADAVKAAVLQLGATRIGHGVRSEQDPAVLDLLRERRITLEMCPTSNVQTRSAPDMPSHPLARYLRSGIRVTVNTDNPRISRVDLAHEYGLAVGVMGLTRDELVQTLHWGIDAAFAPETVRQQVRARLDAMLMEQQKGSGA
ncbi:MAG: adenosine deaminase [Chloroflexi bacterium]|nr:adenosine deaminase [Chloroflexota bacterium]